MQWNKNATTYSESKTNTPNQKPANFFNSQPFSKDFPSNHHFQPFQYCQNPFQQREPNPDDIPLNPDWSIEILTLVYEIIPHIIASCLFQPIGRIWVKLWIFPKVRVNIKKHIWNHHLGHYVAIFHSHFQSLKNISGISGKIGYPPGN